MVVDPDSAAMLHAAQGQVSAAWVQAWAAIGQGVLSVAAIWAAGLYARMQQGHDAAVRATAAYTVARDHALSLAEPLREWQTSWSRYMEAAEGVSQSAIVHTALSGTYGLSDLPVEVKAMKGRYSELGHAANSIQTMVRAQILFKAAQLAPVKTPPIAIAHMTGLMNELRSAINIAYDDISALADGRR